MEVNYRKARVERGMSKDDEAEGKFNITRGRKLLSYGNTKSHQVFASDVAAS